MPCSTPAATSGPPAGVFEPVLPKLPLIQVDKMFSAYTHLPSSPPSPLLPSTPTQSLTLDAAIGDGDGGGGRIHSSPVMESEAD